jgi:hypothetical protein
VTELKKEFINSITRINSLIYNSGIQYSSKKYIRKFCAKYRLKITGRVQHYMLAISIPGMQRQKDLK